MGYRHKRLRAGPRARGKIDYGMTIDPAVGAVCNIGARERARRRVGGLLTLGASAALGVALLLLAAGRLWRLALLPLLYLGLIGLLQAREAT